MCFVGWSIQINLESNTLYTYNILFKSLEPIPINQLHISRTALLILYGKKEVLYDGKFIKYLFNFIINKTHCHLYDNNIILNVISSKIFNLILPIESPFGLNKFDVTEQYWSTFNT